jgi:ABC-2 type transport system ATP-binding protein
MIEASGLTRYYGDFPALNDASFTIQDREIVGFLGLNGAGKSTVLKILAGMLLPTAGRVTVAGLDATRDPDALRRKVGFLPEDPPLYREMRVDEFLLWCGQLKGLSKSVVAAELPKVLETCQLTKVAHRVIGELSHGYQKRVGIAQAIIHKPDVVILDEPISGLDPQQIVDMRAVVLSLKERATVLISSHILSEIAQTCDRILVIHRGELMAEGSEAELGQRIGQGTRLKLVLRAERADIEKVLADEELVASHSFEPDHPGRGDAGKNHALDVELTGDHREDLIKRLVAADIGVRSVMDSVSELEQIFLTRTAAAEAEVDARGSKAKAKA